MKEKQVDLSSFDNRWYKGGGNPFKRTLWYFVNATFFLNPFQPVQGIKRLLLRLFGAKVGKGVIIKPSVNIKYPWLLQIGNHVWIGEGAWIDNLGQITIEDNCCISQGAYLLCGNHDYQSSSFDLQVGNIHLKEGAWVGAKSIVCPGVTVGSHAVLAVNSVAVKDLEAFTIYQGNPAVAKRKRAIRN